MSTESLFNGIGDADALDQMLVFDPAILQYIRGGNGVRSPAGENKTGQAKPVIGVPKYMDAIKHGEMIAKVISPFIGATGQRSSQVK